MYEELEDLVEQIDALSREITRQSLLTKDPKLISWFRASAETLEDMKGELTSYIDAAEAAGDNLR